MSGPGWEWEVWSSVKRRAMSVSEAMSIWWEERRWGEGEGDCSREIMRSSTAVLFVEYVRARWQPWEYSSRAQAAPRLCRTCQYDQKRELCVSKRRWTYPPEAPVTRASRPLSSLSTGFEADILECSASMRGILLTGAGRAFSVATSWLKLWNSSTHRPLACDYVLLATEQPNSCSDA